jgi:ribosomal-protein-alanine N-acetyltransferase
MPIQLVPMPNFYTKRLIINAIETTDEPALVILRSDDRVNMYINRPKQVSLDDVHAFVLRIHEGLQNLQLYYWAIRLPIDNQLIGTICLWRFVEENASAEIGYELHPDHQGQGILQEALVNILDFAENTLQLKQIDAYIHQDNIASRRLVERNGFSIDPVRIDENHEHNLIYIRTRDHAEKPV